MTTDDVYFERVLTFGTVFGRVAVDAPEYIIRVPENLKHVAF